MYRILVSEVMLQQTQVERALPFYKKFLQQFPTAKKLAAAPLADVLKSWQGLGYNRRAKLLREAAQQLAFTPSFRTRLNLVAELEKLPGVGPYTARAIAAFAYNQDVIVIETNIRTAVIHHFFPDTEKVSDADIEKVLQQVLPRGRAREWYSALMDYGAHLKRSGISHNARSTKAVKQSKFAGSLREVRGALVRELSVGKASRTQLLKLFATTRHEQVEQALVALIAEGLVRAHTKSYSLAI
jgi:A/G-specific adenine glycosylase